MLVINDGTDCVCECCGDETFNIHKHINGIKLLLCTKCYRIYRSNVVKEVKDKLLNAYITVEYVCENCGLVFNVTRRYRDFLWSDSDQFKACGLCKYGCAL